MTKTATIDLPAPFRLQSGWLEYCQPTDGQMASLSATELLDESSKLSGTLRYARTSVGTVLMGQCPLAAVAADYQRAQDRLRDWVDGTMLQGEPDHDEVESLLHEYATGCTWKDDQWVIAPGRGTSERTVRLGPEGVSIETQLAGWDSQQPQQREALAEFLCRAQSSIRMSRLELRETQVYVFSHVETAFLDSDLASSLAGVAQAYRSLEKVVNALARTELASAYLEFTSRREAEA